MVWPCINNLFNSSFKEVINIISLLPGIKRGSSIAGCSGGEIICVPLHVHWYCSLGILWERSANPCAPHPLNESLLVIHNSNVHVIGVHVVVDSSLPYLLLLTAVLCACSCRE